uniref:Uncharacterized protein n=1 Tax=Compsopogon caeruleus TaxID=31354 RepID=A0A6T6CRB8_9RHOD
MTLKLQCSSRLAASQVKPSYLLRTHPTCLHTHGLARLHATSFVFFCRLEGLDHNLVVHDHVLVTILSLFIEIVGLGLRLIALSHSFMPGGSRSKSSVCIVTLRLSRRVP